MAHEKGEIKRNKRRVERKKGCQICAMKKKLGFIEKMDLILVRQISEKVIVVIRGDICL